jgi:hypothetical protein
MITNAVHLQIACAIPCTPLNVANIMHHCDALSSCFVVREWTAELHRGDLR